MALAFEPLLVVGAQGMLGRAFCELLAREGLEFTAVDQPVLDLGDAPSIERAVADGVRSVINCAAFTDVDGAEEHQAAADAVNGHGVGLLAARCRTLGAALLHFSTDYVFAGHATQPYAIDEPVAPLNAYGRSKALGEQLLQASGCEHLLVRTSWLYAPWGKNFVITMRGLLAARASVKVVDDQVGRPSSALYVAARSLELLRRGYRGTFHVTDGGQCSWYEFTRAIAQTIETGCVVEPCTSAEFARVAKRAAKRPAYSVLDLASVEAELGPSQPWPLNLREVLTQLG